VLPALAVKILVLPLVEASYCAFCEQ